MNIQRKTRVYRETERVKWIEWMMVNARSRPKQADVVAIMYSSNILRFTDIVYVVVAEIATG